MMRAIVRASVKVRVFVVGVAVALLAIGLTQLRSAPVDVLPEFMPPTVQIQTEALGLSAAEVEQLITVPMEQDLLNGVPWLDQIRSESIIGLSSVDLIFQPGTDILRARQMVQERLSQVMGLPNVGSRPVMIQPLSSTSRVMMIGLSSKNLSPIDMSVLARWKIRPRLMGIPGVANVAIWGQRDRQLQVQVDPDRLSKYGVSLDQVINTTGNALWSSPLTFVEASTPGTGGFIDTANQRFGVQHILPITTPKQLAAVTIEDTSGRTLRLGDVAGVVEDHQPLIGDAVVDDGPNLVLVIQKFPEANILQVTRDVEDALAALAPGLGGITIDTRLFRPVSFMETALHNLGVGTLLALVLVTVLLGVVFWSWRVALVGLASVAVSLVAAAYVLYLRGVTFNVMILAGLVVALGAVVGDAVIDTDTVKRRLRASRASGDSRSAAAVVVDAAVETRAPLAYATVIILLAVAPFAFQAGVAGSFSRPVVVAYTLAVLLSVLVALTLTPALAFLLLSGERGEGRTSRPVRWLQRRADRRYVPHYVGRRGSALATVALLVVVGGLALVPQVGSRSLLPAPRERDLVVRLDAAPGTSLQEMDRVATLMSRDVRALSGVADVGVHVGRAVTSDQVVNVNSGELWVSLARSADYGTTLAAIRRVLGGYPGVGHELMTYEKDQLAAAETGSTHPLVVRVFGHDLGVLRAKAQEVRRAISTVDGVVDPRVEVPVQEPTLQIEVNLAEAERHGIKPGDVRRAAATLLSGLLVGNLYEQQKVFDVVVWGAPATRASLASVPNLLIDTPSGGHVRLRDVASARIASSPTVIRHNDVSRSIDVTADVRDRSLGSVTHDVQSRVRALDFPLEHHAEVIDALAPQRSGNRRLLGLALAAVVGIFLLLQAATDSWLVATLLFLLVPLAAVGGVLTAPLAGGVMSAGALLCILLVLGVFLRNSLLLLAHYRARAEEGETHGRELVVAGTREMAVPLLVATVATAVAVLPFVVFGTLAGEEI
ncbi:MAG TPA: efflux RND transporter permease subunit, partial [Mycobacteriales bacterium]|nr:efflux RND transporter permease subunit [Mycobacteriales bacterium]